MTEAKWKQVLAKPAGALPPNVVQKLGVGVLVVMLIALFVTQMGVGPEEEEFTDDGEAAVVDQGMFGRFVSRLEQDQERLALDQEIAAENRREAVEEEAAAAEEAVAALAAQVQASPPPTAGGERERALTAPVMAQTPGEIELREVLRLEALERRTRSLRTPSLVQTFRSPEDRRESSLDEGQPAEPAGGGGQAGAAPAESAADPSVQPVVLPDTAALLAQAQEVAAASLGGTAPDPMRREPVERTVPGVTGPEVGETPEAARVTSPADPPGYERVYESSVLSAVLVTQLSGDFAGPVLAEVAIPFYSKDRQRILVPRGTRLLGTAQPVQDQDQSRLAVGFHRMVWPDGRWVDLSFHGLNQIGESALEDQVNRHYWSMFAAAGAVGILAGLTLQGANPYAGGLAGFRAGAGQGFGQSATQILQRFLNRMPTITVRAGHRLRVWVTSDFLVPRPRPHPERMYR